MQLEKIFTAFIQEFLKVETWNSQYANKNIWGSNSAQKLTHTAWAKK